MLDAAIEHSRAALLIQPNNADCHTVLAIALDEKGQSAEAVKHYEKALEISPQSVSALNNLAWLLATDSNASLRNGAAGRFNLRGKLTNFPEAPMRSCYGPWQRHMRKLANLEKRLKAPELRCS